MKTNIHIDRLPFYKSIEMFSCQSSTSIQTEKTIHRSRANVCDKNLQRRCNRIRRSLAHLTTTTSSSYNGGFSRDQEMMGGLGGDIGARDMTVGERESNFGNTVLGQANTDHVMGARGKGQSKMADLTKLVNREIERIEEDQKACTLTEEDIYRKQCHDWKVRPSNKDSVPRLRWEVNATDAAKFATRAERVGEENGWPVETTVSGDKVVVETHTKQVKGLTINDFIIATKIEADEEIAAMIVKKPKASRNWI